MTEPRYREEVFNVILAQLLHDRGVVSAPEQILRKAWKPGYRKMPDVLVSFQGLRTAIEGKVGGQPGAEEAALGAAIGRVEQGIGHMAVAVVYPSELRTAPFDVLRDELERALLRIAIYSEAGTTGWADGDLGHLSSLLRRAYEQLVREDVVAEAAATLRAGVELFAEALQRTPGSLQRAAEALGIRGGPRD